MIKKPTQTDAEFVDACGYSRDSAESQSAIQLRHDLADFGNVAPETLFANISIIDTGIIHPTDSIDLIDFTLHLDLIAGIKIDATDLHEFQMVEASPENLTIRQWVQLVIQLRKTKQGA